MNHGTHSGFARGGGSHDVERTTRERVPTVSRLRRTSAWISAFLRAAPRVRHRGPGPRALRGPRRILDAVTEPDAVRRLLAALGLAEPPPGRSVPAA
jgi:hypothetical protein